MRSEQLLVDLGAELTFNRMRQILDETYYLSISDEIHTVCFDWSTLKWAALPELVTMLVWSTKLAHAQKNVTWKIADPRQLDSTLDELRSWAEVEIGGDAAQQIATRLDNIRRQALRRGLTPKKRKELFDDLKAELARANRLRASVAQWIERERDNLRVLDLNAYLARYEVWNRAAEAGIAITPTYSTVPLAILHKSPTSACLPLRTIQSSNEVHELVGSLANQEVLIEILGNYSRIAVAQRGALAKILVAELGHNVAEHSEGSAAWICTRLIDPDNFDAAQRQDPLCRLMSTSGRKYLELTVADNGRGLTGDLASVLSNDRRRQVAERYAPASPGRFSTLDVIDYAFDRLSSRKRNLLQLVQLDDTQANASSVASGLYWIWNVVRNQRGILSIRTAETYAWYDFTTMTSENPHAQIPLNCDPEPFRICGTTIRIHLPLNRSETTIPMGRSWSAPLIESASGSYQQAPIRTVWAGKIAERSPLRYSHGPERSAVDGQLSLWGDGLERTAQLEAETETLLEALQTEHHDLPEGGLLALDLCGTRYKWAKATAAYLCHFFLQMNYTSTVGRSAVILWNVPADIRDVIGLGIKLAGGHYRHLIDLQRIALVVYDDGTVQFFVGWPTMEEKLRPFATDAELTLQDLGIEDLTSDERDQFVRLLDENQHLFSRTSDRIRLRAWPPDIAASAWARGRAWFERLLDRPAGKNGVLLKKETGFFRLPTTGTFVQEFYQFAPILSNSQVLARTAWLLARVIRAFQQRAEVPAEWLVAVTRTASELARHLAENYFPEMKVLALPTVTELADMSRDANAEIDGLAILVTDVVSSGTLCTQVFSALGNVKWLGTVALLQTRDQNYIPFPDPGHLPIEYGGSFPLHQRLATGDLFALGVRDVRRYEQDDVGTQSVTDIDPVTVSPIEMPPGLSDADEAIWPYLSRSNDALEVGHICAGKYHHYIYHFNVNYLLQERDPRTEFTLLDKIVDQVARDLESIRYDPDKTVILHPAAETSNAETIARAVQSNTGALFRHTVHREPFAGQWRFSPYVQHGIPLEESTVILIDDGANSAETLMGLLDAAAFGRPQRILAYIAVTRLPPHKAHLLTRLRALSSVGGSRDVKVKVRFATQVGIPVFTQTTCPICDYRSAVTRLGEDRDILARYADSIERQCSVRDTKKWNAPALAARRLTVPSTFPWTYSSSVSAAQLREAIETQSYDRNAARHLQEVLAAITSENPGSDSQRHLLDLAFVLCLEPELLALPTFTPLMSRLEAVASRQIQSCKEDRVSIFGLLLNVSLQLFKNHGKNECEAAALRTWQGLLASGADIEALGEFVTYSVSLAHLSRHPESGLVRAQFCQVWVEMLSKALDALPNEEQGSVRQAFGFLFVLKARLALMDNKGGYEVKWPMPENSSLYRLAMEASSLFYWHDQEKLEPLIRGLHALASKAELITVTEVFSYTREIAIAFLRLYELRCRLCSLEGFTKDAVGTSVTWHSARLSESMTRFFANMASLVHAADKGSVDSHEFTDLVTSFAKSWQMLRPELNSAFSDIFPNVYQKAMEALTTFTSTTQLPKRARKGLGKEIPSDEAFVFGPAVLLTRFLSATFRNLTTHAFAGWTPEEKERDASVTIDIELYRDPANGDRPTVALAVIDNGPLHDSGETSGHGSDLRAIRRLAREFDCHVVGPSADDDGSSTRVELHMRQRSSDEE